MILDYINILRHRETSFIWAWRSIFSFQNRLLRHFFSLLCHSRVGGNPFNKKIQYSITALDPRLHGDDGCGYEDESWRIKGEQYI